MSGKNPNPVRKPNTVANITDATAAGRGLLTAADVGAQRTLLELGTAALYDDADFATADQGALADSATQPGDLGALALLNQVTDTEINSTKLDGIEASADVTDAGNVGSSIHGATAKATPVDADTVALIDSEVSNVLKTLSWANIKATLKTYFDTLYRPKAEPYWIGVALSANKQNFAAGESIGHVDIQIPGNVTAWKLGCDPESKPSAANIECDLNRADASTGARTSLCSTVASIATGGSGGAGVISGTQAVSVGERLVIDGDQGSDGKDVIGYIQVTPTF